MRASFSRLIPACVLVVASAFGADSSSLPGNPSELAEQALVLARAGSMQEALALYRRALIGAPDDMNIRRDYATVLGWNEDYTNSIKQFQLVFQQEPQEPNWAMIEFARSALFGGSPATALQILDRLIQSGDTSENTLCRKGFALRELKRPKQAEEAYQAALAAFPHSTAAKLGLIYSLADQNRLGAALSIADKAIQNGPDNWELLMARGQLLNWIGWNFAASSVFRSIPEGHQDNREVLEGRIAAARWGGDPAGAKRAAASLADTFPDDAGVRDIQHAVALEFGKSLSPMFRFASDSDGFSERLFQQNFALHAGPANQLQFGFEDRTFFSDNTNQQGWRRYSASWSGNITPRLGGYASVANLRYSSSESNRFLEDGSLNFTINDRLRASVGGGTMAMDAFQAVQDRVQADFLYTDVTIRPTIGTSLDATYAHYDFTGGVSRDKFGLEGFHSLVGKSRFRLAVGGSANTMRHNHESAVFFSPRSFHTVLAEARVSGRLSRRLEYETQVGSGFQREPGASLETPMTIAGSLIGRLTRSIRLRADFGRSTSSLEKIDPGRKAYSRSVVAIGLDWQLE